MSSFIFHPKADIGLFEEFRANLKRGYVVLWHNPDLQHPLELGPIMAALPTFGAECLVIAAFQTWRRLPTPGTEGLVSGSNEP